MHRGRSFSKFIVERFPFSVVIRCLKLKLNPFSFCGCSARQFCPTSAFQNRYHILLQYLVHQYRIYPINTLPEHLRSTILRTPKLPENTHNPKETSFHPPSTLVPLLANYPHSHYLGVPPTHTPF